MREHQRCPTCAQYSHSIGTDALTEAFLHFQAMVCGHPLKSYPTDYAFSDETRDMAQRLMAGAQQARAELEVASREIGDAILARAEDAHHEWLAGVGFALDRLRAANL